jgi:hypothetical protein
MIDLEYHEAIEQVLLLFGFLCAHNQKDLKTWMTLAK